MNEARRALAAIALPDGIYAIGGYDGRQYLATVEK
jgi:influenza virus NS1A-binding protein